ncbi:MAG: glutamate-cysteine ligase family protein [Myxococcota bacterium]|jgi:glutamate--cysteine ligase|nr:glutamate-cysteine ligase family protein [Myxococcota bacterium]
MSLDSPPNDAPIENLQTLLSYHLSGAKERAQRKLGLEHELFGFDPRGNPASVEQLRALLRSMCNDFGWEPQESAKEPEAMLGLRKGAAHIAVEPGGQLELASGVHHQLDALKQELEDYVLQLRTASAPLGLRWLAVGSRPHHRPEEIEWMPRRRYAVMRECLRACGISAEHMMKCTCTVQPNLDFENEEDLRSILILGHQLCPIVLALFANSPFRDGRPSGLMSTRSLYWSQTDPNRTGYFPCISEPDFELIDWLRHVYSIPTLLQRDGNALRPCGLPFSALVEQRHREGRDATLGDWELHLSTIFPVIRFKRHVEFRCADGVPQPYMLAMAALWKGLLYDPQARAELPLLLARPTHQELLDRHERAMRLALADDELRTLARQAVELARQGLGRLGANEAALLDPLESLLEHGSLAQQWLRAYAANPAAGIVPSASQWPMMADGVQA